MMERTYIWEKITLLMTVMKPNVFLGTLHSKKPDTIHSVTN